MFPFNNLGFPFGFPLPWENRANRYTLPSVNVTVGTENVIIEIPNHAFLNKNYVGSFFLDLRDAIPAGTTATLPILIYEIHYNRYTNQLYIVNGGFRPSAAATA